MENEILFSIVTVCFNSEKTIRDTIQSVICQKYTNYEYLIVDGASKDSTLNIVQSFNDPHIKLISEPDQGVYDAMNKGLAMAEGDYVLFLGSDDLLYNENVLSSVANYIQDPSCHVYYGDVIKKKKGNRYDGEFNKIKWGYENICHQSVFYPKYVYKSHMYDLRYKLVADWVYNLILLSENIEFRYIHLIISEYNDCDGVSSTKDDALFLKNRRSLVVSAVGLIPYLGGLIIKACRLILK